MPNRFSITAPRLLALGLLVALAVIGVDQLTKWLVLGPLQFGPDACLEKAMGRLSIEEELALKLERGYVCKSIEISSVFDLSMVWNTGVSFGLFSASNWVGRALLIGFAVGLSGVMAFWLTRTSRGLSALGLGFVIGGALGNVIDRVRFGAVVDFFNFGGPWFGWRIGDWPVGFPYVFNVADAAINVGVAILIIDWLSEERARKAASVAGAR